MDPIRTLLLARTHTVVLDPDRVAAAATRPIRVLDVDKFEDELLQLGYVMSLDLAMTIRRLPQITELRTWIVGTLADAMGQHRPHVPLFRPLPDATPYARRVLTWLHTRADQPCPWCSQQKGVGALDPCGHLVCRSCWDGGTYAGCPICHRRVAPNEPFLATGGEGAVAERVGNHRGELRIVHLAFDLVGVARARFERLVSRTTPLSREDRGELETVIDAMGPKAATWLPRRIPVKETMAIAIGRLWLVSPDRSAMVKATQGYLTTATDALRVAAVLGGGDPALVEPVRVRSFGRGLRRAVLEALDVLAAAGSAAVLEDMRRHAGLWKRIGERLHPFEHVARLPSAALAFAAVRGSDLAAATFGDALRARAGELGVPIVDDRVVVRPWAGPVEQALRAGDARAAAEHLAPRPVELLRRADHLVRAAQPAALADVIAAIKHALTGGPPGALLSLGAHLAQRGAPWPRRVFLPRGAAVRAWGTTDTRPPLPPEAIATLVANVRGELLARAEARRRYARAIIDRGLSDLPVPLGERTSPRARVAWPRGSEVALPDGAVLRLVVHWEQPVHATVDLDLSVALYDEAWQHVATCDFTNLVVAGRAAVHSGDVTDAPPPHGASEFVDLDLAALAGERARHAVVVVFSFNQVSFDRLAHGFAGIAVAPEGGRNAAFDARAVPLRFDLAGSAMITIPLLVDLAKRKARWLDVRVRDWATMRHVGGYRAALAHAGRDFTDHAAIGARPTLWDLASIHAAARANVVYVRSGGRFTTFRRRDGEAVVARLARIHAGEYDGAIAAVPPADAPTWVALLSDDVALPAGSGGYLLDARGVAPTFTRATAAELVAELAAGDPK